MVFGTGNAGHVGRLHVEAAHAVRVRSVPVTVTGTGRPGSSAGRACCRSATCACHRLEIQRRRAAHRAVADAVPPRLGDAAGQIPAAAEQEPGIQLVLGQRDGRRRRRPCAASVPRWVMAAIFFDKRVGSLPRLRTRAPAARATRAADQRRQRTRMRGRTAVDIAGCPFRRTVPGRGVQRPAAPEFECSIRRRACSSPYVRI